jgi:hypothetical protein
LGASRPRRKYAADKSESPKGDKAALAERANHDDIIPPDHDLVGLFIGHWRINGTSWSARPARVQMD